MQLETIGSPMLWVGFIAFVLAMLAIDLGVFQEAGRRGDSWMSTAAVAKGRRS